MRLLTCYHAPLHWQIVAGLVFGLLLIPPMQVEYTEWRKSVSEAQERDKPVLTVNPVLLERTETYARFHLKGYKHKYCEYLSVIGFRVPAGQQASDVAWADRIDAPNRQVTRPVGPWDAGVWQLELAASDTGWIEMRHDCNGVVIQSVLARVNPGEMP